MNARYAYFPGCSAKGSCRELDMSTEAVAAAFGLTLEEMPEPGCTGARQFRAIDEDLHLAANGRILALAEARGGDLAVVCDTCLLNLTEANTRLCADAAALARVNDRLAATGLEYRGTTTVRHFLWILLEDVGEARIRDRLVRPLDGLRVAPFYGCHIRRPAAAHGAAAAGRADALERLCRLLGAEPVDYDGADGCCGFHVLGTAERTAYRMSGSHLAEAKDGRAHCMVTPCPLCHTVLDAFQPEIERQRGERLRLPVLHVAQLVGLALGLAPRPLGLARHMVPTSPLLAALSA